MGGLPKEYSEVFRSKKDASPMSTDWQGLSYSAEDASGALNATATLP